MTPEQILERFAGSSRADAQRSLEEQLAETDLYVERELGDDWTIWYFRGATDAERSFNLIYGFDASWCEYSDAVDAIHHDGDAWGEYVWNDGSHVDWRCYNPELLVAYLERIGILPADPDGRVPKLPLPGNPTPYFWQIVIRQALYNDIHKLIAKEYR